MDVRETGWWPPAPPQPVCPDWAWHPHPSSVDHAPDPRAPPGPLHAGCVLGPEQAEPGVCPRRGGCARGWAWGHLLQAAAGRGGRGGLWGWVSISRCTQRTARVCRGLPGRLEAPLFGATDPGAPAEWLDDRTPGARPGPGASGGPFPGPAAAQERKAVVGVEPAGPKAPPSAGTGLSLGLELRLFSCEN